MNKQYLNFSKTTPSLCVSPTTTELRFKTKQLKNEVEVLSAGGTTTDNAV